MAELRGGSTVGGLPVVAKEANNDYIPKVKGSSIVNSLLKDDGSKLRVQSGHLLFEGNFNPILALNGDNTANKPMLIIGEAERYGVTFQWNSGSALEIGAIWSSDIWGTTPTVMGAINVNSSNIADSELHWKGRLKVDGLATIKDVNVNRYLKVLDRNGAGNRAGMYYDYPAKEFRIYTLDTSDVDEPTPLALRVWYNGAYKTVYHEGNLTPSNYLAKSGGTMTGDIAMSTGKGITWGAPSTAGYIREGSAGQLNIGSDDKIDFYETDENVLAISISTNSKTLDAKGGLLENGVALSSKYLQLSGGTLTGMLNANGHVKLASGGEIHSGHNNSYFIKDHANGNITLSATGSNLYLGYTNTSKNLLYASLYAKDATTIISDTTGKLHYQGNDIDSRYLKITGGTVTGDTMFSGTLQTIGTFQSLSPLNNNASMSIGWLNNDPRIRIGGSGDGASGVFRIQGTGDTDRMTLDSSGNAVFTTSVSVGDTGTKMIKGQNSSLRVQTSSGYLDIGAQNTSYVHFNTDRPLFYFYKDIKVNGNTVYHEGNLDISSLATDYLPLTGGALTGALSVAGSISDSRLTTGDTSLIGLYPTNDMIYVGNESTPLRLRAIATPTVKIGSMTYNIHHTGNFTPSSKLDVAGGTMTGALNINNSLVQSESNTNANYIRRTNSSPALYVDALGGSTTDDLAVFRGASYATVMQIKRDGSIISNGSITVGGNAVYHKGNLKVSSSAPSGGVDGDIWIQI